MKSVKFLCILMILGLGIQFQAFGKSKKAPSFDFEMKSQETLAQDVKKILPAKSNIVHKITEGVFGPADGSKGNILIIPFTVGPKGAVQVMLLVPVEKGKYKKMLLGNLTFPKMKSVEIKAVFFDQADKEKERDLLILCAVNKGKNVDNETAVFVWKKTKFVRSAVVESKLKGLYPSQKVRSALSTIVTKGK